MALSVVTNIPSPYRDEVFRELQERTGARIYLLAEDEPGRHWAGRQLPYDHTRPPAFSFRGPRPRGEDELRPSYIPIPTWLARRGYILVAGFGVPAILTALCRPRSTLIWSPEATVDSEQWGWLRQRVRKWLVGRSCACVSGGDTSRRYLAQLGAREILTFPNVAGTSRGRTDFADHPTSTSEDLVIVHVGDWSRRKGADITTQVFHRLSHHYQHANFRVTLLIVGTVRNVPIPAGASHLGYLPREILWATLRARSAKFLVLMSRSDRWPFVIAEAMAAGISQSPPPSEAR